MEIQWMFMKKKLSAPNNRDDKSFIFCLVRPVNKWTCLEYLDWDAKKSEKHHLKNS